MLYNHNTSILYAQERDFFFVSTLNKEIRSYQYSKTNEMHFLYSVYYELMASTCFEHYLSVISVGCYQD
jgi:hypothetical protein